MYSFFVQVFPHPSFFLSEVFSHGHELAACPKTIGVSVTPALHFVRLTPSYNGASIVLFLCLVLSLFVISTCHLPITQLPPSPSVAAHPN